MTKPASVLIINLLCAVFGLLQQADAKPAPSSFVHRTLDCGAFTAQVDTLLAGLNSDFETQGLYQTIRLKSASGHHWITLPIFQRRGSNRNLHGKKVLDGLVYEWACLIAENGVHYILLDWSCINPDSKTCESAMSIREEWTAIYDIDGHHLPADPRNMTPNDEFEIRRLGLWHDFEQDDIRKNGG